MKFPKKVLFVFTLFLASIVLFACQEDDPLPPVVVEDTTAPVFSGVSDVSIAFASTFDPLAGVSATDNVDSNVTSSIVVTENNVDTSSSGAYYVAYSVSDAAGNEATAERNVTVNPSPELATYLSGVDLSKLSPLEKGKIFAAAERYLLENVYAGVPLYTSAARILYSDRLQLFSETYNGVMGFGTKFSQFTEDDSHVIMYGSTYGNVGEYTWRASYSTDPTTLNPWNSDDSATSDFADLFEGGLYNFFFDSTKISFEILPELANVLPIPVNPVTINGKEYAKIWQIPLRNDLEWTFHPDTDVSGLPVGYEKLDANDYLWTWKYALDNDWFRARTGGGDFVSQGIKNAAEYLDDSVAWSEVGIRMATGETNVLELEYVSAKSEFEILYGFAGNVMTPICEELFTELGGVDGYGVGPETVAASGRYYFDQWTPGQLLTFKRNDNFPQANMFHYTGYQYTYLEGTELIFEEFINGKLESASLPSAELENYASDPGLKVSPAATTWRLQINSFGTEANRDAYIEANPGVGLDETFVPEPILQYLEMRQALMFGFDRYHAAVEVVGTYLPAFTLFTSTYFLDGDSGLGVRQFPEGQAIVDDFGGGSYGYFPDAARALFTQAVARGIADGYYTKGSITKYTTIALVLTYASSGNTNAQAMVASLEEQYEALLVDNTNFVKVDIQVADVQFPGNYYDYMMIANTDIGIGGIQGSLLDAPSFLDVFADDNRGGFTLNWGIDTHTPNIEVTYVNIDGVEVTETWGFNALISALVGKAYIKDGIEQDAWDNADDLIAAYLDMAGETLGSKTTTGAADLAEYILGDDLAGLATEAQVDSMEAYIVTTASGNSTLYILTVDNRKYELSEQIGLATDAESAIKSHSGYGGYASSVGPLTDAEVAANAYLIGLGDGYGTIAEIAVSAESPLEFTEIYSVTWDGWDDVYVVLHIGDYYIGWAWL